MPDRALRMGNTNGLSRGSRGTAPISRPWEVALSRHPVARPLSPARLRRCNLNSDIRRMEHQEYPKGEASMLRQRSLCIFMQPHATKRVFCSRVNPSASKGFFAVSHPSVIRLPPSVICSYYFLLLKAVWISSWEFSKTPGWEKNMH